jgi:hypothetical protein
MFLKQSTKTSIVLGPFVDETDGKSAETGLSVPSIDVDLYKFSDTVPQTVTTSITPNASGSDTGSANDMVHMANGYYSLELSTGNTDACGPLKITANISGALPVWGCYQVVEEVVYDALFASGATGAFTGVSVNALTTAALTDVWATDTLTEAYAADGAAATPAQLLYMLWAGVNEFSISGDTITAKKLDGSTTAMTWTLDDSSSPTSRTRAT